MNIVITVVCVRYVRTTYSAPYTYHSVYDS